VAILLRLFHGDSNAVPPGDWLKPESIAESMKLKRKLPLRPTGEACQSEDCRWVMSLGPGDHVLSNDRGCTDSARAALLRAGERLDKDSERLERSTCDFRERSRSKLLNGTDTRLSSAGLIHRTKQT